MFTKNKIIFWSIASLLTLVILILGWRFYYLNLRGVGPAINKSPIDITTIIPSADTITDNKTTITSTTPEILESTPLKLPAGFSIGIFAKNLPGARVMIFDSIRNIWLSQTRQGTISKLILDNGRLVSQKVVISGLKNPHGLAFDPQDSNILYIAEETKISRVKITDGLPGFLEKIIDLPVKGNHFTRSLLFSLAGRLYVSIGSTCNVCLENDERYAAIYSLNKDGSDFKQVARGLRNSVFMIWDNQRQAIWATEMGRDLLGDNTPPDEINIISTQASSTLNFGWPICYGQNIHDTVFDKNTYFRNPCQEPFEKASQIDLQAHSAPLGLAFTPNSWPTEYKNNLLVAFHGSWNRSVATGYKVVRLILDDAGKSIKQEDFISGWLSGSSAFGRPVDVIFDQVGNLYISDDKAGVIYKVFYK
ncbi:MAG: PQQ-dependent sugar dehydrogenase [Patescibacteria group bacterium]